MAVNIFCVPIKESKLLYTLIGLTTFSSLFNFSSSGFLTLKSSKLLIFTIISTFTLLYFYHVFFPLKTRLGMHAKSFKVFFFVFFCIYAINKASLWCANPSEVSEISFWPLWHFTYTFSRGVSAIKYSGDSNVPASRTGVMGWRWEVDRFKRWVSNDIEHMASSHCPITWITLLSTAYSWAGGSSVTPGTQDLTTVKGQRESPWLLDIEKRIAPCYATFIPW